MEFYENLQTVSFLESKQPAGTVSRVLDVIYANESQKSNKKDRIRSFFMKYKTLTDLAQRFSLSDLLV